MTMHRVLDWRQARASKQEDEEAAAAEADERAREWMAVQRELEAVSCALCCSIYWLSKLVKIVRYNYIVILMQFMDNFVVTFFF
jgi:hypothetical protein